MSTHHLLSGLEPVAFPRAAAPDCTCRAVNNRLDTTTVSFENLQVVLR